MVEDHSDLALLDALQRSGTGWLVGNLGEAVRLAEIDTQGGIHAISTAMRNWLAGGEVRQKSTRAARLRASIAQLIGDGGGTAQPCCVYLGESTSMVVIPRIDRPGRLLCMLMPKIQPPDFADESLFRTTFEQSLVGIAHVSLDGHWLRVNDEVCSFLGYDRDTLLTLDFQRLTHPDDLTLDLEQLRDLLDGRIDNYRMEKRYLRRDGAVVWANLRVALRRNEEGKPLYFINIVEDINERKLLEQALRDLHDQLEERVAERTRELEAINQRLLRQLALDPLADGGTHH